MMVALAGSIDPAELRERRFFLAMVVAIMLPVLAGFGLFALIGISSFASPWWVHVHALTFMGWIALFAAQVCFVRRDDLSAHRRLGRIGAVYWVWMVLVGLALTPVTLAVGRSPPFFTPPYFLALDWVNIVAFALLAGAGVANRHRTDWHRRLMLCATICVIAPAWGRLIVLTGSPMLAAVNVVPLALYVILAMLADKRIRGAVHPAYWWGLGAILAMVPAIEGLARIPAFVALGERIAG
jgi:uncharacterized membrane protein YozB (DUF420 family)